VHPVAARMSYAVNHGRGNYLTRTQTGIPRRTNSMPVESTNRAARMVIDAPAQTETCRDDTNMVDINSHPSKHEGSEIGDENRVR